MAKKSKGFDKSSPKVTKPSKKEASPPPELSTQSTALTNQAEDELNAGQKALAKLRSQQQATKDEELRKIRDMRSIDESIRDDPTAAVIPEKVAMRMGSRMLPFVGIPLFGTMGAFVAFWYLRTYKNIEFETNVVAFTTIGLLAVGLLVSRSPLLYCSKRNVNMCKMHFFSVMSASWDPDREGSTFGADEFSENVNSIKEGLARSRENLVLREKMAGLPENEIQEAIQALDKRDEKARAKKMSLKEKMKNELE